MTTKDAKNKDLGRSRTPLGRPPLAPEDRRSHRIVTFVTDLELQELKKIAEREHRSVSATVHHILATGLGTARRDEEANPEEHQR